MERTKQHPPKSHFLRAADSLSLDQLRESYKSPHHHDSLSLPGMSSTLTKNSRSFSLTFPFGYQLNLKTTVNGMLSVKFRNPQSSVTGSLGVLNSSTEMIDVLEESNVNRLPSMHDSHSEIVRPFRLWVAFRCVDPHPYR